MGKLIHIITMEFDELKKIWDTQNDKPMYVIDESMIHRKVLNKKKQAGFRANMAEFVLIASNLFAASLIGSAIIYKGNENTFSFIMMCAMFVTALVLMYSRFRRKKNENRFDNSTLGELQHALANATYQVRLHSGILYFAGLVVILTLASLIDTANSLWMIPAVVVFFGICGYAARWEHRVYVGKKRELEKLMKKLKEEPEQD